MRLTCPNCGAEYEVSEGALPSAGRHVQCSACHTRWFVRGEQRPAPSEDQILSRLESRSPRPRLVSERGAAPEPVVVRVAPVAPVVMPAAPAVPAAGAELVDAPAAPSPAEPEAAEDLAWEAEAEALPDRFEPALVPSAPRREPLPGYSILSV